MDDQPVVDGGEIPIGICAKLREPIDWKLWEHTLLAHAHLLGIQDYVTKGKPSMKVPVEPSLHDITYTLNSSALRLDLTNPDKARIPFQISHLTPESAEQFERDQEIFRAEMKQFSFYQPLLRKLARWIISTTSPILFSLCCKANKDVHDWYRSLKLHFEDLLENEILMVNILVGQITKDKEQPQTVEEARQWLDKWEDTMDKAHMIGYPISSSRLASQLSWSVEHFVTPREWRKVMGNGPELDWSHRYLANHMRLILANKEDEHRRQAEGTAYQDSAPSDGDHRANSSPARRGGRRNQRRGRGRN